MYEQLKFDFCFDSSNYVVQSNSLVEAKQNLSINAAKIIRGAIMQIRAEDDVFMPYCLNITELAEFLGISRSNLYRDVDKIRTELLTSNVQFKQVTGRRERWVGFPWVSVCEYDSELGFSIQLNPALKPYLLSLQRSYTQYTFEEIKATSSVYSLRIFEMIQARIKIKKLPINGLYIEIPIQTIKEALDCEDKYERTFNFKTKVLDIAVRDINENTTYRVSYECIKTSGRAFDTVRFYVNMSYHPQRYLPQNND